MGARLEPGRDPISIVASWLHACVLARRHAFPKKKGSPRVPTAIARTLERSAMELDGDPTGFIEEDGDVSDEVLRGQLETAILSSTFTAGSTVAVAAANAARAEAAAIRVGFRERALREALYKLRHEAAQASKSLQEAEALQSQLRALCEVEAARLRAEGLARKEAEAAKAWSREAPTREEGAKRQRTSGLGATTSTTADATSHLVPGPPRKSAVASATRKTNVSLGGGGGHAGDMRSGSVASDKRLRPPVPIFSDTARKVVTEAAPPPHDPSDRLDVTRAIFEALDGDGDCFLSCSEMRRFAEFVGLDAGATTAWEEEFRSLCEASGAAPDQGIGQDAFSFLLNDKSERGLYCKTVELRAVQERLSDASNASVALGVVTSEYGVADSQDKADAPSKDATADGAGESQHESHTPSTNNDGSRSTGSESTVLAKDSSASETSSGSDTNAGVATSHAGIVANDVGEIHQASITESASPTNQSAPEVTKAALQASPKQKQPKLEQLRRELRKALPKAEASLVRDIRAFAKKKNIVLPCTGPSIDKGALYALLKRQLGIE